jgi:nucleoid-associated protein YejK
MLREETLADFLGADQGAATQADTTGFLKHVIDNCINNAIV